MKVKSLIGVMLVVSIGAEAQEWKQLRMTSLPARGYEIRTVRGDLLGYSERGSLALDTLQPAMQAWLSYVNEAAAQGVQMAPARATGKAVKPLLKTQWSQDAPYNNSCPCYTGTTRSATGCVATAMAQIMNYWRWPAKGKGSIDYTTTTNRIGVNVNFDVDYDWDHMLDKYTTGSYSDTAAQAVATLMYHCGASCQMNYGSSSGADDERAANALKTNFYYSDDMDYLSRNDFTYQAWDSIIRAELDAGRPVMHSGYTTSLEGHEFVCDGYDVDGYFHFNWGWGGSSDGYFLLTALTPLSQGTGGSSNGEGFNYRENIVTRIYPNQGTTYLPVGGLLQCGSISGGWGSSSGRSISLTAQNLYNASMKDLSFTYGLALYDTAGTKLVQMNQKTASINGQSSGSSYYGSTYTFDSQIPNGMYYVRLDYKVNNRAGDTSWHTATGNGGVITQLKLTIGDNSVTIGEQSKDTAVLSLVSLEPFVSRIVRGSKTLIRCTMVNQSDVEFNDIVQVFLANTQTGTITTFDKTVACFHANDTTTLDFIETLASKQDTGDYQLGIYLPHQTGSASEDYKGEYYLQAGYSQWAREYYTFWGGNCHIASGLSGTPVVDSVRFDEAQMDRDSTTMAHVIVVQSKNYYANYLVPWLTQSGTKKKTVGAQQFVVMQKGDTLTWDVPIDDVSDLECGEYGLALYPPSSGIMTIRLSGPVGSLVITSPDCEESALEEVEAPSDGGVRKIWKDGELLILRDGVVYDLLGRKH